MISGAIPEYAKTEQFQNELLRILFLRFFIFFRIFVRFRRFFI